ncbi:hypothetical protein RRG08_001356, partial [Elysia crispata]
SLETVIMTSESNSPSISGSKSVLYPDQIKPEMDRVKRILKQA